METSRRLPTPSGPPRSSAPRLLATLLLAWCASQAQANTSTAARLVYRLPYDVDAVRARQVNPPTQPRPCPPFIAPPRQLQHEPRYRRGDPTASVVDPERAAAEIAATRPVRDFNRLITNVADYALRAPAQAAAQSACVIAHLDHWATGEAFLGKNSMQGEFEKKWGAITYSLAFMESRWTASEEQSKRIRAWLRRMGNDVYATYSRPGTAPASLSSGQNNHAYWAALSATTVGMAVDDSRLFEWGMQRFRAALGDIDADGYLPLELQRGSRALAYHIFALEPLLLLAAIAQANDQAVLQSEQAVLKRLSKAVRAGLEDPSAFARLTGLRQEGYETGGGMEWAWAELAMALWDDPALDAKITSVRPYTRVWLGGDVTLRYARQ